VLAKTFLLETAIKVPQKLCNEYPSQQVTWLCSVTTVGVAKADRKKNSHWTLKYS